MGPSRLPAHSPCPGKSPKLQPAGRPHGGEWETRPWAEVPPGAARALREPSCCKQTARSEARSNSSETLAAVGKRLHAEQKDAGRGGRIRVTDSGAAESMIQIFKISCVHDSCMHQALCGHRGGRPKGWRGPPWSLAGSEDSSQSYPIARDGLEFRIAQIAFLSWYSSVRVQDPRGT